jgi:deazaflavin-dependent oxidoreductase (nitroreductase family)
MSHPDRMTYSTPKRTGPGKLGLWFARAPRHLYHTGLGRLLTGRFVLVEHVGRKTGILRETVLEVMRRDDTTLDVAAAHGPTSDWYRNLQADPNVRVSTGPLRRVPAQAATVDLETAGEVFARYAQDHARAAKFLAKAFDIPTGDPAMMARTIPLVRITLESGVAPA